MKLFTKLLLFTVTMLSMTTVVNAAPATELRMRILPKDCVFDIIDSGTQELLYYTPDACGFPSTTPVTPPSTAPTTPSPTTVATTPRPQLRPDVVDAPVLDNIADGTVIEDTTVELVGSSTPGAQINIYENGVKVGSVFADVAGKWTIRYSPTTSPVTLTFEACVNGACSVLSKTTTLYFKGVSAGAPGECNGLFTLQSYRFWDKSTKDTTELTLEDPISHDGVIKIDWGNGVEEVFTYDANSPTQYSHTYKKTGNYNGTIRFQKNVTATSACQTERYFSVGVTKESKSILRFWPLLLVLPMCYLYVRKSKKTD